MCYRSRFGLWEAEHRGGDGAHRSWIGQVVHLSHSVACYVQCFQYHCFTRSSNVAARCPNRGMSTCLHVSLLEEGRKDLP